MAHDAGVPVIVDAAGQLPPAANLKRFIADGADLVAFSGGKAIGGPQATGILCGRRDLIMSAALQQLDFDIFYEQWQPPERLIDKHRLKGVPQNGIGRPCKTGREDIVGLLTALELFLAEGDDARHARWLDTVTGILAGLEGLSGTHAKLVGADDTGDIPMVELTLEPAARLDVLGLDRALQAGTPAIHAEPSYADRGVLLISPICLAPGQAELIAPAIRNALNG